MIDYSHFSNYEMFTNLSIIEKYAKLKKIGDK